MVFNAIHKKSNYKFKSFLTLCVLFYRQSRLQAQRCVSFLHSQYKRTTVCLPEGSVGFIGGFISPIKEGSRNSVQLYVSEIYCYKKKFFSYSSCKIVFHAFRIQLAFKQQCECADFFIPVYVNLFYVKCNSNIVVTRGIVMSCG